MEFTAKTDHEFVPVEINIRFESLPELQEFQTRMRLSMCQLVHSSVGEYFQAFLKTRKSTYIKGIGRLRKSLCRLLGPNSLDDQYGNYTIHPSMPVSSDYPISED